MVTGVKDDRPENFLNLIREQQGQCDPSIPSDHEVVVSGGNGAATSVPALTSEDGQSIQGPISQPPTCQLPSVDRSFAVRIYNEGGISDAVYGSSDPNNPTSLYIASLETALRGADSSDPATLKQSKDMLLSLRKQLTEENDPSYLLHYLLIDEALRGIARHETALAMQQIGSIEISVDSRALTMRGDLDGDPKMGFSRFEARHHEIPALRYALQIAACLIESGDAPTLQEALRMSTTLTRSQVDRIVSRFGLDQRTDYYHYINLFDRMASDPARSWLCRAVTAEQLDRTELLEVARAAYEHGAYALSERNFDIYFAGEYAAAEARLPYETFLAEMSVDHAESVLRSAGIYEEALERFGVRVSRKEEVPDRVLGDGIRTVTRVTFGLGNYMAAEEQYRLAQKELSEGWRDLYRRYSGCSGEEVFTTPEALELMRKEGQLAEMSRRLLPVRAALQRDHKDRLRRMIAAAHTGSSADDVIWREYDSRQLMTDQRWWEFWRMSPLERDGALLRYSIELFGIAAGGFGAGRVAQGIIQRRIMGRLVERGLQKGMQEAMETAARRAATRMAGKGAVDSAVRRAVQKESAKAMMAFARRELGAEYVMGVRAWAFACEAETFHALSSAYRFSYTGDSDILDLSSPEAALRSVGNHLRTLPSSAAMLLGYKAGSAVFTGTAGSVLEGLRPVIQDTISLAGTTVTAAPVVTALGVAEASIAGHELSERDVAGQLQNHVVMSLGLGAAHMAAGHARQGSEPKDVRAGQRGSRARPSGIGNLKPESSGQEITKPAGKKRTASGQRPYVYLHSGIDPRDALRDLWNRFTSRKRGEDTAPPQRTPAAAGHSVFGLELADGAPDGVTAVVRKSGSAEEMRVRYKDPRVMHANADFTIKRHRDGFAVGDVRSGYVVVKRGGMERQASSDLIILRDGDIIEINGHVRISFKGGRFMLEPAKTGPKVKAEGPGIPSGGGLGIDRSGQRPIPPPPSVAGERVAIRPIETPPPSPPVEDVKAARSEAPVFSIPPDAGEVTFGRASSGGSGATYHIPEFDRMEGEPSTLSRRQVTLTKGEKEGEWVVSNRKDTPTRLRVDGGDGYLGSGGRMTIGAGRHDIEVFAVRTDPATGKDEYYLVSRFTIEIPAKAPDISRPAADTAAKRAALGEIEMLLRTASLETEVDGYEVLERDTPGFKDSMRRNIELFLRNGATQAEIDGLYISLHENGFVPEKFGLEASAELKQRVEKDIRAKRLRFIEESNDGGYIRDIFSRILDSGNETDIFSALSILLRRRMWGIRLLDGDPVRVFNVVMATGNVEAMRNAALFLLRSSNIRGLSALQVCQLGALARDVSALMSVLSMGSVERAEFDRWFGSLKPVERLELEKEFEGVIRSEIVRIEKTAQLLSRSAARGDALLDIKHLSRRIENFIRTAESLGLDMSIAIADVALMRQRLATEHDLEFGKDGRPVLRGARADAEGPLVSDSVQLDNPEQNMPEVNLFLRRDVWVQGRGMLKKGKYAGRISGKIGPDGEEIFVFTEGKTGIVFEIPASSVAVVSRRNSPQDALLAREFIRVREPQFGQGSYNISGSGKMVLVDFRDPRLVAFLTERIRPILDALERGDITREAAANMAWRAVRENVPYSNNARSKSSDLMSLGEFVAGGVCNERGMLLQVALQYLGIESRMEKGRFGDGRHAWVRLTEEGLTETILDPQSKRPHKKGSEEFERYVDDGTDFDRSRLDTAYIPGHYDRSSPYPERRTPGIQVSDIPAIVLSSGLSFKWPDGRDVITVGRAASSDINIADKRCSKEQVRIIRRGDGRISIEHKGTNPTVIEMMDAGGNVERMIVLGAGNGPAVFDLEPGRGYRIKVAESVDLFDINAPAVPRPSAGPAPSDPPGRRRTAPGIPIPPAPQVPGAPPAGQSSKGREIVLRTSFSGDVVWPAGRSEIAIGRNLVFIKRGDGEVSVEHRGGRPVIVERLDGSGKITDIVRLGEPGEVSGLDLLPGRSYRIRFDADGSGRSERVIGIDVPFPPPRDLGMTRPEEFDRVFLPENPPEGDIVVLGGYGDIGPGGLVDVLNGRYPKRDIFVVDAKPLVPDGTPGDPAGMLMEQGQLLIFPEQVHLMGNTRFSEFTAGRRGRASLVYAMLPTPALMGSFVEAADALLKNGGRLIFLIEEPYAADRAVEMLQRLGMTVEVSDLLRDWVPRSVQGSASRGDIIMVTAVRP